MMVVVDPECPEKAAKLSDTASSCETPVEQLRHKHNLWNRCTSCLCSKYCAGIGSLVIVVILWVGSGFLTKDILRDYDKPFLMSALTASVYNFYFIFLCTDDPLQHHHRPADEEPDRCLDLKKTALVSLGFFFPYFLAECSTNFALSLTSVSSAGIMMTTNGLFILLFGCIARVETLTIVKSFAALTSAGGVSLLGSQEMHTVSDQTFGNVAAIASALFYGAYSVYLKWACSKGKVRLSQPMLFAFAGLYALLFTWPVFLILHYYGVEKFELPKTKHEYFGILINLTLGGLVPNYLWNVAFAFTSELVVAIGVSFCLPLTMLIDHFLFSTEYSIVKIFSAVFVCLGFILINFATVFPEYDISFRGIWDKVRGVSSTG